MPPPLPYRDAPLALPPRPRRGARAVALLWLAGVAVAVASVPTEPARRLEHVALVAGWTLAAAVAVWLLGGARRSPA